MLNLRAIDHIVLRVRDIEAMRRFYCDVLGCSVERVQEQLGLTQLRAGESLLLQGRWDESGACLQRSAELHAQFGAGQGGLSWLRLAELAVCRGDSATAQA